MYNAFGIRYLYLMNVTGKINLALTSTTQLTPRETEILESLSEGLCDKDIASRHGISIRTTNTHLVNIFSKLKRLTGQTYMNRVLAVRSGIEHGLIPPYTPLRGHRKTETSPSPQETWYEFAPQRATRTISQ